jgi:outer membrane cobalamin receptor
MLTFNILHHRFMNKQFLISLILTIVFVYANAQPATGPQFISIKGSLIESESKEAVEYANVSILEPETNNMITGVLSDEKGRFLVEVPGRFKLVKVEVTYLGFRTLEKIIELKGAGSTFDMGVLTMEADRKMLDEVVVTAEQATMNLYVDRKVFNVEKDLSTRGGSGEDVLRNVPGLEVDAEGNVMMRNTSAQIFIDGRPTTLELQNLPAEQIDLVEVITNPSAKFDASSSGGIINIRLKRNRKPGYNGTLSAGLGTTDRYNAMANLNIRREPFNLSLTYNLMNAGNNINTYTNRTSFRDGGVSELFNQTNDSYRGFRNQSFRAVLDYNLTDKDLLSFTGNVSQGGFFSNEEQMFSSLMPGGMPNFSGNQFQENDFKWNNYSGQLYYQKRFTTSGREFTADITYNRNNRDGFSDIETFNFDNSGQLLPFNPVLQLLNTTSTADQITFQTDYVTPLGNGSRFETGARVYYQRTDFSNLINRFSYEEEVFFPDSILSNQFDIIDNINAAYVNYVSSWGSLNYQAGLRFEHSFYQGNILNQETTFSYEYPNRDDIFKAFFPSLFLSRKFGKSHELQFNVSRKIGRPRWWQLAPRVNIEDPRNLQLGNPELTPEFINLSEINYSFQKGNWSLVSSVYGRLTEDPINWVAFPFEGNEEVLVRQAVNGTYDYNFGVENIIKWTPNRKLDITLSMNTYYIRVNTNTPVGDFTNTGYTYDIKPMITYRLPWDLSLQLNGSYFAPRIIPQGETIAYGYMDFSLNKRFGKKWTINMMLSDVFDSNFRGQIFETPTFFQENTRRRQARFFRVTASYTFGKTDPSWLKNKRGRNGRDRGGDEMDMDF